MRTGTELRKLVATAVLLAMAAGCFRQGFAQGSDQSGGQDQRSPHVKLRSVSLKDVRWTDGFWATIYNQNRRMVVPNMWRVMQMPDNAATFNDLRMAAGVEPKSKPGGTKWSDGDCHKLIETMAHLFEVSGDDITLIASAKWTPGQDARLLGGVTFLEGAASVTESLDWSGERLYQPWDPAGAKQVRIKLIPYYSWANRGISQMKVWLPASP